MRRDQRGFALVAVLVILAVAMGLAGAALVLSRSTIASAGSYEAEMEGGHAAEAAIRLVAIRLADSEAYGLDDAAPGPITIGGWNVTLHIEDEAGKIDLNRTRRERIEAQLAAMGVDRGAARNALQHRMDRFVAVDDLADRLDMPAAQLPALRRAFTVHGAAKPLAPGVRSPIETYRIVALATRKKKQVQRWSTVRLHPGFSYPFEWLDRGH